MNPTEARETYQARLAVVEAEIATLEADRAWLLTRLAPPPMHRYTLRPTDDPARRMVVEVPQALTFEDLEDLIDIADANPAWPCVAVNATLWLRGGSARWEQEAQP